MLPNDIHNRMLIITAPHFTAGVELNHDNEACHSAPILAYMVNAAWTEQRVRDYCITKGWTVEEIV